MVQEPARLQCYYVDGKGSCGYPTFSTQYNMHEASIQALSWQRYSAPSGNEPSVCDILPLRFPLNIIKGGSTRPSADTVTATVTRIVEAHDVRMLTVLDPTGSSVRLGSIEKNIGV